MRAPDAGRVGASALELNIYHLPARFTESGAHIEQTYLRLLRDVKLRVDSCCGQIGAIFRNHYRTWVTSWRMPVLMRLFV